MANQIARRLRKTMTPQEVKMWNHLRAWRELGFHFRRQAPHGDYIVDFACLKYRLVVEIDGGQHNFESNATQDRKRDSVLQQDGFLVLLFWNSDIDGNLRGVLESIHAALMQRAPHPAAFGGYPPPAEEG